MDLPHIEQQLCYQSDGYLCMHFALAPEQFASCYPNLHVD